MSDDYIPKISPRKVLQRLSGPAPTIRETTGTGRNQVEDDMLEKLELVSIIRSLSPSMREALKSGDLTKMQRECAPWAFAQMVAQAASATSDSARNDALKELLNRALGKPTEKSVTLNLGGMTEDELDSKLLSSLNEVADDLKKEAGRTDDRPEARAAESDGTEEGDEAEKQASKLQ